jgi:hypothetical protein
LSCDRASPAARKKLPYSHHQRLADGLESFVERLGADRIQLAQHGLESALHVGAMVAVADGLVERC